MKAVVPMLLSYLVTGKTKTETIEFSAISGQSWNSLASTNNGKV